MKLSIVTVAVVLATGSFTPALAGGACDLFESDARQSAIPVRVHRGFGLNLNFIPTAKTIRYVSIGDPSGFVLSSDGQLCPVAQKNCTSTGATVINLRQINPIHFENLPRSPDGSTLLTLIAEGKGERSLYQFILVPASGTPRCTTLAIRPDLEKPTPVVESNRPPLSPASDSGNDRLPIPEVREENTKVPSSPEISEETTVLPSPNVSDPIAASNSTQSSDRNSSIAIANDIVYGLGVASKEGQINYGTRIYRRVQTAIRLLRRGSNLEEAARRSSVPLSTLQQLARWGQNRY